MEDDRNLPEMLRDRKRFARDYSMMIEKLANYVREKAESYYTNRTGNNGDLNIE